LDRTDLQALAPMPTRHCGSTKALDIAFGDLRECRRDARTHRRLGPAEISDAELEALLRAVRMHIEIEALPCPSVGSNFQKPRERCRLALASIVRDNLRNHVGSSEFNSETCSTNSPALPVEPTAQASIRRLSPVPVLQLFARGRAWAWADCANPCVDWIAERE